MEERNFAKPPLTREEIEELVDLLGIERILSTRNATVKERGWTAERPPDRATFVAAATADNNLIRRPILVKGDQAVIGKDESAIRALLA